MDQANKEKMEVEFIELGTKLILEILAEEYPNKDFKVDCNPIKTHKSYHFFVEDRIGDIGFKVVLTWEDLSKTIRTLQQKYRQQKELDTFQIISELFLSGIDHFVLGYNLNHLANLLRNPCTWSTSDIVIFSQYFNYRKRLEINNE